MTYVGDVSTCPHCLTTYFMGHTHSCGVTQQLTGTWFVPQIQDNGPYDAIQRELRVQAQRATNAENEVSFLRLEVERLSQQLSKAEKDADDWNKVATKTAERWGSVLNERDPLKKQLVENINVQDRVAVLEAERDDLRNRLEDALDQKAQTKFISALNYQDLVAAQVRIQALEGALSKIASYVPLPGTDEILIRIAKVALKGDA